MVKIENDSVLSDFVSAQERSPHRRHINTGGRITYVSQNDFGPLRGSLPMPELGDFNLAFPGPPEGIGHLSPIQSHRYRAPEVLLGIAWTSSADIWNLGLLVRNSPWQSLRIAWHAKVIVMEPFGERNSVRQACWRRWWI